MIHDPIQAIRDTQDFGEQGGVVPVIDVAATSTFLDPADMNRAFRGEIAGCYLYSRHSNPTVNAFGKKMAAMEGMEAGLGVASGMAAISCTIEQLVPAGGHIVSSRVVYGGTYALFAGLERRRGVKVTFVDPDDLGAMQRALRPETRVVYTETMSNPLLAVSDLEGMAKLAHDAGAQLVVDNTFTPLVISPARFGADVVVYSCTKYVSGSSDLIAGAIVSSRAFVDRLIDVNDGAVMLNGPVMDPRVAHELYLRLDHLGLRMAAHSRSADHFSRGARSAGVRVIYPGLVDHPHHARLSTLSNPGFGCGGMATVDCGSADAAMKLARKLQDERFGLYAVSLGFSRTLMSIPASSTSSEIPEAECAHMGLTEGLLRLSIGYTGDDAVMLERFLRCYRETVAG